MNSDSANRLKTISLAARGSYLARTAGASKKSSRRSFRHRHTTLNRLPEAIWKSVLKPDILSVPLVAEQSKQQ